MNPKPIIPIIHQVITRRKVTINSSNIKISFSKSSNSKYMVGQTTFVTPRDRGLRRNLRVVCSHSFGPRFLRCSRKNYEHFNPPFLILYGVKKNMSSIRNRMTLNEHYTAKSNSPNKKCSDYASVFTNFLAD